ncbi:MAG: dinucleotide-utilizing protein [Saprospirales bacterium]|nr:MAG: dinucleotide-utilizing protein [Saprospirales bacterium]
MDRFQRQINLRGLGVDGQNKLQNASVLVVGAGGLGCPALQYLAAAGIGKIGILDGDRVTLSNLNRQVLFGRADTGKLKAVVAAEFLTKKYGDSTYIGLPYFLDNENAIELIGQYDLVLDCTDNFASRYLINDACVLLNKPFVQGAIFRDEGQLAVFNYHPNGEPACNYRDLYPTPPNQEIIPDCNETGVLGVLPGIIGTYQASEAVKIICKRGIPLVNTVMLINIFSNSSYLLTIRPRPTTSQLIPSSPEAFKKKDYGWSCASVKSLSWEEARGVYEQQPKNTVWVDVRERGEKPELDRPQHLLMSLSELDQQIESIKNFSHILLFCKSGLRSRIAAEKLSVSLSKKEVYSITGGLDDVHSPANSKKLWQKK